MIIHADNCCVCVCVCVGGGNSHTCTKNEEGEVSELKEGMRERQLE